MANLTTHTHGQLTAATAVQHVIVPVVSYVDIENKDGTESITVSRGAPGTGKTAPTPVVDATGTLNIGPRATKRLTISAKNTPIALISAGTPRYGIEFPQ